MDYMDYSPEAICKRQECAESERTQHENTWDEAFRYYSPQDRIIDQDRASYPTGEKKTEYIFDSTAQYAVKQFATIVDGYLTPRSQRWHSLRSSNKDLMKVGRVARWFDDATDILFNRRYASRSNFAAQNNEALRMLGMCGNGVMFVDEFNMTGVRYKSEHIYDIYFFENEFGIVDCIHRKFVLTAANAYNMFGEKCSDKIKADVKNKPDKKYEFLHVVGPNKKRKPDSFGPDRFPFISIYLDKEEKVELKRGGYASFPYCVYRDVTAPRDVYATGAGQVALADTKMLNLMAKTDIRASQRAITPPLLAADGVSLFRNKPDAINIGTLGANGQQLVQPLNTGANIQLSDIKLEQRRMAIKDTFLVNLFQLLTQGPEQTATEVLEKAREKGVLLTPLLGRLQSEGLGPLIQREIEIAMAQDAFPQMPPELIEAEGEYEIEYDSPLSRAQKAEEAVGIQRQFQFEASMGVTPDMLEMNYNMDEARRIIAVANGVPARVMLDEQEVQERKAAAQQQQQMMAAVQAAPQIAKATKDLSDAQSKSAQASAGA